MKTTAVLSRLREVAANRKPFLKLDRMEVHQPEAQSILAAYEAAGETIRARMDGMTLRELRGYSRHLASLLVIRTGSPSRLLIA